MTFYYTKYPAAGAASLFGCVLLYTEYPCHFKVSFHEHNISYCHVFVAVAAGFINVVSGGGGFLSITALLISGLPPANALATNKMQALGSSLTSGIYFLRQGGLI